MACGWEISYSGCSGDTAFLETLDADMRTAVEDMATDLLDQWTGGLFGACPETIRPCRAFLPDPHRALREFRETATGNGSSPWMPVLIGGRWFNIGCGRCGGTCACLDGTSALSLPWPVETITSITIDGEPVPADAYRVEERRLLIRQDGGSWPLRQDLGEPAGAEGTFVIEYLHGLPVPTGGQIAAGVLAMELAKAMCNDGSCQLPRRVQTVTRQGVTVAMLDGFDDIENGRTGIWLIDSWVASVTAPRRPSAVHSVDIPSHQRGFRNVTV